MVFDATVPPPQPYATKDITNGFCFSLETIRYERRNDTHSLFDPSQRPPEVSVLESPTFDTTLSKYGGDHASWPCCTAAPFPMIHSSWNPGRTLHHNLLASVQLYNRRGFQSSREGIASYSSTVLSQSDDFIRICFGTCDNDLTTNRFRRCVPLQSNNGPLLDTFSQMRRDHDFTPFGSF